MNEKLCSANFNASSRTGGATLRECFYRHFADAFQMLIQSDNFLLLLRSSYCLSSEQFDRFSFNYN